jgi:hypothetical protein
MLVSVTVFVMKMQDQHPRMGFAQDMDDGGAIGMGEGNSRSKQAKRVGLSISAMPRLATYSLRGNEMARRAKSRLGLSKAMVPSLIEAAC